MLSLDSSVPTFGHANGDEKYIASSNGDEIVVRRCDHGRRDAVGRFLLGVKEVVANRTRNDRLPMLFHEDIPAINYLLFCVITCAADWDNLGRFFNDDSRGNRQTSA